MRHTIYCLLTLLCTPFLNCSEPPEKTTQNSYVDPAELTVDKSGHETWYKKVDGKNQYLRNQHRKNHTGYQPEESYFQKRNRSPNGNANLLRLMAAEAVEIHKEPHKSNS